MSKERRQQIRKKCTSMIAKAYYYPVRKTTEHLFGDNHNSTHKMSVGFVIMFVGVCVAKSAHVVHLDIISYFMDLIGYALHGVGASPYIEHLIKASKSNEEK